MHLNFCTLFDSKYLFKGLAMYQSLNKHTNDYTLYIFAFDDLTYHILNELELNHVVVIPESEIVTEELRKVRQERTRAEYCWTCTPIIIEKILESPNCDNCTYLDSDIFFWDDPRALIEEMLTAGASVLITPHYFNHTIENKLIEKTFGKYCVQFNTFMDTPEGRLVLTWWKNQCIRECSVKGKWGSYGDQKYQDEFIRRFKGVHELSYRGGGIAPWNVGQFMLVDIIENGYILFNTYTKKKYRLIFYHFQDLKYIDGEMYDIGVYTWQGKRVDAALIMIIYEQYIRTLRLIEEELNMRFKITDKMDSDAEVKRMIMKSKVIQPFECGIYKQLVISLSARLGAVRRRLYRKFDYIEFKEKS